jgi:hypothetical protein
VQLGFTSRKTGNEFIPSGISRKNFRHFLRGFSDGDGSMCLVPSYGKKVLSWELTCASREFLEALIARIRQEKIIHTMGPCVYEKKQRKNKREKPVFKVAMGHADSVAVGQFMYLDASLKLKRKHRNWQLGAKIQLAFRHWSASEISLAMAGTVPKGRSKAAYYAIRYKFHSV